MVKIRLSRKGKKNDAFYHIVVVDSQKKRDGEVLAKLGTYNPNKEKDSEKVKINTELYNAWLSKGAQVTETVVQIINSSSK